MKGDGEYEPNYGDTKCFNTGGGRELSTQLGDLSEPQPDIALVHRDEPHYAEAYPTTEDVLLLVEVADSSIQYDRETKIPLYARYAIPEVWIIDLNNEYIHQYR